MRLRLKDRHSIQSSEFNQVGALVVRELASLLPQLKLLANDVTRAHALVILLLAAFKQVSHDSIFKCEGIRLGSNCSQPCRYHGQPLLLNYTFNLLDLVGFRLGNCIKKIVLLLRLQVMLLPRGLKL